MLRECDRETVEALSSLFLKINFNFLRSRGHAPVESTNYELLNAIAVAAASVLASAPEDKRKEARDWFILALDNQIADLREQFGQGQCGSQ